MRIVCSFFVGMLSKSDSEKEKCFSLFVKKILYLCGGRINGDIKWLYLNFIIISKRLRKRT